ncbi:MAG: hypothetical protein ACD_2C00262G0006 [uncultured bacterium (gcode 4)]|uniref:DOT1 domain-containing protein n=1 Tax=uncultured bacterium (gcode 4) TaxID=1234023 RepID=K2G146_9BACT|nr:MAG: hypothetical protein ACD_2C00262G0006 [uncultured bacterium (gcode 4)]
MVSILFLLLIISFIPMLIFAPWVPTRYSDIERIGKLTGLKEDDVVYDLGSGDGKVIFWLSKMSNCKFIWIESFIFLYLYSILKKYLYFKDKNIDFRIGNIFNSDLSDATVIYVFWFPEKMGKLTKKLLKECKKWTRVISYSFEIGWLKVLKKDKPSDKELTIYAYEI